LRLQEQNALATAKKSEAGGAEDCWIFKKRELEQVKITLQERKEREEEESKNATNISEEEQAAKNEFDSSSTESSKGGNESAFSPDQSKDEDSGKCVICVMLSHIHMSNKLILALFV
jgi:hypothetical protein